MVTSIPGLPLRVPAALLCILGTGPNYTADMPSVERVKAEIQGSDPTDTLARQFAVFSYLSTANPATEPLT
jgi:hypothetical protein